MTLVFENLGGDVVGGSTDGFLPFTVVLEAGGKSKVSEFDFHVFIEEEVSEFETKNRDDIYSRWMTLF